MWPCARGRGGSAPTAGRHCQGGVKYPCRRSAGQVAEVVAITAPWDLLHRQSLEQRLTRDMSPGRWPLHCSEVTDEAMSNVVALLHSALVAMVAEIEEMFRLQDGQAEICKDCRRPWDSGHWMCDAGDLLEAAYRALKTPSAPALYSALGDCLKQFEAARRYDSGGRWTCEECNSEWSYGHLPSCQTGRVADLAYHAIEALQQSYGA